MLLVAQMQAIDLISQAAASPIRTDQLMQNRGWLELVRSFRVLDEVVSRRQLYLEMPVAADRRHFRGFALVEKFTPGAFRLEVSGAGCRLRSATAPRRSPSPSVPRTHRCSS